MILMAVVLLGIVGVRQLIPSGLGGMRQVVPFLFFSEKRATYTSPNNNITVAVYSNDAGAAHSGMFPTWVIMEHWYGDEVIAKGYLSSSRDTVPLVWTGPRTITIRFAKDRYDETPSPQTIEIPGW